jgi:hypothetical protein
MIAATITVKIAETTRETVDVTVKKTKMIMNVLAIEETVSGLPISTPAAIMTIARHQRRIAQVLGPLHQTLRYVVSSNNLFVKSSPNVVKVLTLEIDPLVAQGDVTLPKDQDVTLSPALLHAPNILRDFQLFFRPRLLTVASSRYMIIRRRRKDQPMLLLLYRWNALCTL